MSPPIFPVHIPHHHRFPVRTDAALELHFRGQDIESLRLRAFHLLSVRKLAQQCNPLGCWMEQDHPITPDEVRACLLAGHAALRETPLWTTMLYGKERITAEENRVRHIQKIAYFMSVPISKPISIDVGCPRLTGRMVDHLVDDGNHRLAAYILLGRKSIPAHVGGEVSEAKRRGLWNPTPEEQEVCRRETLHWEQTAVSQAGRAPSC